MPCRGRIGSFLLGISRTMSYLKLIFSKGVMVNIQEVLSLRSFRFVVFSRAQLASLLHVPSFPFRSPPYCLPHIFGVVRLASVNVQSLLEVDYSQ